MVCSPAHNSVHSAPHAATVNLCSCCRAISDWLVANSVAEALSAAGYDPRLRASQQKVLAQAATVVSKYLEKIAPRRTADATPPCPVKLSLKSQFGRPSFGALTLDVNAQVATVRDVYELASGLLRHPVSRLHLQTQAGKHVRRYGGSCRGIAAS